MKNPQFFIIINSKRLEAFSLRLGARQGCPSALTTSVHHCIGASGQEKRPREKGILIRREEVKLSLFIDMTYMCVKILRNS